MVGNGRVGAPVTILIYCAGLQVPVGVNAVGENVCTGCGTVVRIVT